MYEKLRLIRRAAIGQSARRSLALLVGTTSLILLTGCATSAPRPANPSPMYVELVGDDTTIEMAHFCRLTTVCGAGNLCQSGEPDLSDADQTRARDCAQSSKTCRDYRACWRSEEPASNRYTLDPDNPSSICQAQADCFGSNLNTCLTYLRENPMRPSERRTIESCGSRPRTCGELRSCLGIAHVEPERSVTPDEDATFRSVRYDRWRLRNGLPALASRNPEAARTFEQCLEVSDGEALCSGAYCPPAKRRQRWMSKHQSEIVAATSAWSSEFGGAPPTCSHHRAVLQMMSIRDQLCACTDVTCLQTQAKELEKLAQEHMHTKVNAEEKKLIEQAGKEAMQCVTRIANPR